MARLRNVDEDAALQGAMRAFWQHGYQALGTRQLEAETGITRFTLQTTYGGKMALFVQTLDAYLDQMDAHMLPEMADGTLDTLAGWFERRCDPARNPEAGRWGCLMIASINAFADTEPAVSARAVRFETMLREAFAGALAQIDQAGALSPDLNRGAATQMLVAASIGLNTVIRAAGDCRAGTKIADGIAAMVRGWAS
ncbi:TetR/AcrR family transcriptional regulator [Sulfitobacter aestuariivivens]|uniref:TetR/AcrR family transcriptional regulator n=1 Tax=Sulfitobacter aestuariivivens TaxID=2766981 RepID=A0A927D8U2_9RHOB|nr:TetR/AcrR family transcriptional regulator [Sulfitobacter aestuariivivens]MBD3665717.1 TetR/AcrR family transcriptional regulator [Sulfitobacter aestuariivivens]